MDQPSLDTAPAVGKRPQGMITPGSPSRSNDQTTPKTAKEPRVALFENKDTSLSQKTYKLQRLQWDYIDNRRTNDDVHGSIPLNPVVKCFLDTRPMQRLRGIKQLGTVEYVYFNCNHGRFEHSVGVSFLAGKVCQMIRQNQPSLLCTAKDVVCVQLAGLMHDIGHGPFSHLYEQFVLVDLPNHLERNPEHKGAYNKWPALDEDWRHEVMSLTMIDAVLEEIGLKMDIERLDEPLVQIGDGIDATSLRAFDKDGDGDSKGDSSMILTSRDMLFVKECVWGKPIRKYTDILGPGFHGRPHEHQEWMYDIVANRHSGLDVDKIDYYARDQRRALKESGEIDKAIVESAVVAWAPCTTDREKCHRCSKPEVGSSMDVLANEAVASSKPGYHLMICYPKKLISACMEFFQTRFALYSKIYKHKTHEGFSVMVSDILCLADPHFLLPVPPNRRDSVGCESLPISRAMQCPETYLLLKDSIIDLIAATTASELEPARALICRLHGRRDLYKCIGTKVLRCQHVPWDQKLWDTPVVHIVDKIVTFSSKLGKDEMYASARCNLTPEDVIVTKYDIHHGQKDANPISKMRFLEKNQLNQISVGDSSKLPDATVVEEAEYMSRFPRTLREYNLRVYCRNSDKAKWLSIVFEQWWDKHHPVKVESTHQRSESESLHCYMAITQDCESSDGGSRSADEDMEH